MPLIQLVEPDSVSTVNGTQVGVQAGGAETVKTAGVGPAVTADDLISNVQKAKEQEEDPPEKKAA